MNLYYSWMDLYMYEPPKEGVWVVYYHDKSAVVPFKTEIEALREAVSRKAEVKFVPYGEDL